MEYYLAIKSEILTICNNMNGPRRRQVSYDFTYMWNLKNKINEQTKQKWIHGYRDQPGGFQSGERLRVSQNR